MRRRTRRAATSPGRIEYVAALQRYQFQMRGGPLVCASWQRIAQMNLMGAGAWTRLWATPPQWTGTGRSPSTAACSVGGRRDSVGDWVALSQCLLLHRPCWPPLPASCAQMHRRCGARRVVRTEEVPSEKTARKFSHLGGMYVRRRTVLAQTAAYSDYGDSSCVLGRTAPPCSGTCRAEF